MDFFARSDMWNFHIRSLSAAASPFFHEPFRCFPKCSAAAVKLLPINTQQFSQPVFVHEPPPDDAFPFRVMLDADMDDFAALRHGGSQNLD